MHHFFHNQQTLLIFCCRTFIYSYLIRGGKPTPVGICLLAFTFCSVNGYIQVRSIQSSQYPDDWLSKPIALIGITLFFLGLAINIHSDHILRNLRKPGETGYKIPRGQCILLCIPTDPNRQTTHTQTDIPHTHTHTTHTHTYYTHIHTPTNTNTRPQTQTPRSTQPQPYRSTWLYIHPHTCVHM